MSAVPIDRKLFLSLTALLASCKAPEVAVDAPVVAIPSAPTASGAKAAKKPDPPPLPGVVATEDDDDVDDDEPAWPGTAKPPANRTIRGQTCPTTDNLVGTAPACRLTRGPGPTCESFADTRSECADFGRWLVPRVAERAGRCLDAKSGTRDICLFNVSVSCVMEALRDVCVDASPRIVTECKQAVDACKAAGASKTPGHMTQTSCVAALSGIKSARHGAFLHCAAESCTLLPCLYAAAP